MAMRAQTFECVFVDTDGTLATAGGQASCFTVLFNRIMVTKATEFIVIEHLGSSPLKHRINAVTGDDLTRVFDGFVQVKINTTEYFLYPDGSRTPGIPNIAAPYPISVSYQPVFILYPDVYVLPGQNWDVLFNLGADDNLIHADNEYVYVFVKYTLYDGTDAVIANKLLEMGITVRPQNIDWYKRKLIEKSGGP